MIRFLVVLTLCCSLSASAHSTGRSRVKAMPIDEAISLLNARLRESPDDAATLTLKGKVHYNVYRNGMRAVGVAQGGEAETPRVSGAEVPALSLARRMDKVPPDRLRHLAEAVRAFQQAHELQPDDTRIPVYLAFALNECRDRYPDEAWPLSGTAFDETAREMGDTPSYWEDAALALVLPAVQDPDLDQKAAPPTYATHGAEAGKPYLIDAILSRRADLTEEEAALLARVAPLAKQHSIYMSAPLSAEDLQPPKGKLGAMYPLSPAGDATAQLYLRAVDSLFRGTPEYEELPVVGDGMVDWGKPLADDMLERIAEYLSIHDEAFRLMHQAGQQATCRYPVDLTMELRHLAPLRDLARLLALKALHAAEHGDGATAAAALEDGLRLANSLRHEPMTVSQLVRIALNGIAVDMLEKVMNRTSLNANSARRLQALLEEAECDDCFPRLVEAERQFTKEILTQPQQNLVEYQSYGVDLGKKELPTSADIDAIYDAMLDACTLPFAEASAAMMTATEDGAIGLSGHARTYIVFIRERANLRNAATALAVERYWSSTGMPPTSLQDLVPAYLKTAPLDPFDDQPLRLIILHGGFVVYSVADNMKDDEGLPGKERPPLDIAFSVGQEWPPVEAAEGELYVWGEG